MVVVERQSISLSRRLTATTACSRFAAEHPMDRTDRSTAGGANAQQQLCHSMRFTASAGSVVLTAELMRLNTDLFEPVMAW